MNKVFKTALDKACGTSKIVDQFHYIYFKNGYIYASNGVVHLKQLMQLHGIAKKTADLLNNQCVHKDVFAFMNRYKNGSLTLTNRGAIINVSIGGSEFKSTMKSFGEVPGQGLIVDQIDNMTNDFQMESKKEVAIDPVTIELLRKVFVTKSAGFTLRFNRGKTGVLITPNQTGYKEHAIVKTLLLTGEINK